MKTIILALVIGAVLTGCPQPKPSHETLICRAHGNEVYRATTTSYADDGWIFTHDSWWNRNDNQQYRPALDESCYTK